MIRLMLIDDHALIRQGLKTLLSSADDIDVIGDCGSILDAEVCVQTLQPQVIVIHWRQSVDLLATALTHFKRLAPAAMILVMANSNEESLLKQLFSLGVSGFLGKQVSAEEIVLAVRKVANGVRYVPLDIAKRLTLNRFNPAKTHSENPFDLLSSRERQCAGLLAEGKSSVEIGQLMAIATKTVNTYRFRILQKLQVTGEVDLVKCALRHGLLDNNNFTIN